MTEQEVTYTTVRFHKSSVFQNEVRSEETQSAKEIGHRESSVPWKLIVIALGILCLLLLVTVAVLVTNIFQYRHELQKTRNRHHNCSTMENDINLKEETLRNMSVQCIPSNTLLNLFNREQNRWYKKTKTVLASPQHTARCVEMHWFCHGIKCYYFIMDIRTWHECKQTCQNYNLSFLKIDDKDELKFLQEHFIRESYWIGLSYNNIKKEWSWIDNSPLNCDLLACKPLQKTGYCIYFSMTGLHYDDCGKRHLCICEKGMDKITAPLCSVKERSQSAA
ncbi:Ly49 inhibitory receptor 5 [Rattus norvegicus]|uniref:Immunoreceptor Ly49i5 n=1 Tax=Rattus norvegicus TaxID=10116 RepID=Q5MPV0_RAT|nr:Ly49 inhibitory receptor 5 [Rattus norvegicus]AAV68592.1 immunoreceptor Ly49i5 [Rattus norvegicus]AAV74510.1 Ly49 inhibitory receptor 5 [Rattus norvegicus]AAX18638.1 Ly49 inhibitory receptor 5 [Rattus norvegicus]|eukprot:NP_001009501.1 Ly49 inhibitory receptor 5 [Rattus norvegicus]